MADRIMAGSTSISLEHLLDEHVRDTEGRDIGKVEDLVLDSTSGTIDFAVVKFGGFLGVGGAYHLIPWPMLTIDSARRTFRMNVSKEQIDRAPSFDRSNVPRTDDTRYLDSVFQYWGLDRTQQHQRMQQVQYGEQRAAVGTQDRQRSGGSEYQQVYGSQEQYQRAPESQQQYQQSSESPWRQQSQEEQRYQQSSESQREYQPSYESQGQYPSPYESQQYAQSGEADREAQNRSEPGYAEQPVYAGQRSVQGDVSYGGGQYGPERRAGDAHSARWTGGERRAGW